MPFDWVIRCSAHVKTESKGSMIEISVSAGKTHFAHYFSLADINTTHLSIHRWLGESGVTVTKDVRKKIEEALTILPDPVDGWIAETPGWHGGSFVLPTRIFGGSRNIINLINTANTDKWKRRSSLRKWQSKIAKPLKKSPVAVFALSAALAGPILQLADLTSLVFMLVGPSSVGKTTLMELCGSVWGGGGNESFTDTFLKSVEEFETAALQHRDTLLTLDEAKLLGSNNLDAAQKFQKILYRYESEKPKKIYGRPSSNQALRGVRFFTSNRSAANILRDANLAFEGQEAVRILEINVSKDEFPVFVFPDRDTADVAKRVNRLKRACRRYCGSASRTFLDHLVKDRADGEAALTKRIKQYIDEGLSLTGLPSQANSIDHRIAAQVAVVYATGRLAHAYGVLPFRRKLLSKTFKAIWANIHRQALASIQRDPVRDFVRNLPATVEKMANLNARLPEMTRAEAEQSAGFKKARKSGGSSIYLSAEAFARLTPMPELVLHWLDAQGFLHRDGGAKGTQRYAGKRQTKVTVGRKPDGSRLRLRMYELSGDIDAIRRKAGEDQ